MPPNGAVQTDSGGAGRIVSAGALRIVSRGALPFVRGQRGGRPTFVRRGQGAPPALVRRRQDAPPALVRRRAGSEAGQATVELVALLPLLVVVLAGAWQAVLAGQAAWAAGAAARAAARAHAVGTDPTRAARTHLPRYLEQGLRVMAGSDGDVEVRVRIPSLPGLPSPGHANAGARFEPQS